MRSTLAAALVLASTLAAAPSRAEPAPLERGLAALEASDYAAAEKDLVAASAAAGRGRARALLGLARVELATGRAEAAAKHASDAAGDGAVRVEATSVAAEALARLGRRADAIALLGPVAREKGAYRAALALGALLVDTGRRAEARAPLMQLVTAYNDGAIGDRDAEGLALVGRAAALLRSASDANEAFSQAERAGKGSPARVETLLFRADLFLEKYDPGHAAEVVADAKKIAPNDPRVHVARARVVLENSLDFAEAEREADAALAVDRTLPGAWFVKAGLALRTLDLGEADRAVDAGLAGAPGDLDLLAMRAAVRFLADDPAGFERAKRAFFARNAESTRLYQVVGEYADWEHRYDDIVKMMREATRLDPDDARAWADLGMNLIRAGDEDAGLEALRRAWKKDRYNVRVYNTLNLYEKEIAVSYETVTHGPFKIRWPKDEAKILARYVPAMLDEAWKAMVARYGFTPKGPIFVELYGSREQFSVRTAGLPRVGIEGVCFGRTLAAMTPKAEPANWGNVLWHELAHVFAIQLSDSRVPRWFTEGLSEWETIARRPEWRREEDPALWVALRAGRIPPLSRMNRAFTHAEAASDVVAAYYASSQVQVFLAETVGTPKVVEALRNFGRKMPAPEAIQKATGLSLGEIDVRFRAWLERRLARYAHQLVPDLRAPKIAEARARAEKTGTARAKVELALALLAAKQPDEAARAVDEALADDPIDGEAMYVKARLLRASGDVAGARELLVAAIRMGIDGYGTRMQLAEIAAGQNDRDGVRKNLEIAHEWDPSMSEPVRLLWGLAKKDQREADELALLRELATLEQHDRGVWRALVAKLEAREAWDELRAVAEAAIFVDPESWRLHASLSRALAKNGDRARAAFEAESALACDPPADEGAKLRAAIAAGP